MAEPFTLTSQTVGCLPVLNHFLARIGLSRLLASYLPTDDARLRLAPAAVIGVAVANIVVGHRPVYALAEWAAGYHPACSDSPAAMQTRSTTTGWAGCWIVSSTPTGPAWSPKPSWV